MALSRDKKNQVVAEVTELLDGAKLTVVANYPGTSVQAMQRLRRDARANGTKVRLWCNEHAIKRDRLISEHSTVSLFINFPSEATSMRRELWTASIGDSERDLVTELKQKSIFIHRVPFLSLPPRATKSVSKHTAMTIKVGSRQLNRSKKSPKTTNAPLSFKRSADGLRPSFILAHVS